MAITTHLFCPAPEPQNRNVDVESNADAALAASTQKDFAARATMKTHA